MGTSRIARLAATLGGVAALLFVGGPALARLELTTPLFGFGLLLLGALLGLVALVLGVVGLYLTRPATGRSGRGPALLGAVCGGLLLVILVTLAGASSDLPRINDITTNPSDPPRFSALLEAGPNAGRDMDYPAEFAAQQRKGYPDLAPIQLDRPPAEVLSRAEGAMRELGWEIVAVDPARGTIEANDTSQIFRFVDDIVVRVRPSAGGSVVDVRSKSRDGRGDLGANAARIRALRDALTR
jgi:uncharacterized protein (DUF1499 family)